MSENEVFSELLRRMRKAHRRYCMVTLVDLFTRSLFYLALACALVLGIVALTPLELNRLWFAVGILLLSVPITLALFLARPIPLNATAIVADKKLRLKEKISSALEFGANLSPDQEWREWQAAVLRDALHETNRLDLKNAFPWPKPREGRWLWAPMLALLLTVFLLPQWNLFGGPSAAAGALEQSRLEKELAFFEKQTQMMMERREQSENRQETAELAREVKELIQELSKGRVEQREALAKLSDLQEKWEQRRQLLSERRPSMSGANQPLQNRMLGQLMQDLKEGQYEQARQKMEELQKQMKMGALDQPSLERLGQELQQLAAMMGLNTPLAQAMQNAGEMLEGGDIPGDHGFAMLEMIELELEDLLDMLEQMALMDELLQGLQKTKQSLSGQCSECGGPTDGAGHCLGGDCQGGVCSSCGSGNCSGDGACSGGSGSGQGQGPPRGEGSSPWAEGDTDGSSGGGMGGPGQGAGGQAPFEETATELNPERLRSGFHAAPIQGILPVDGEAVASDSAIGFSGVGGGNYRQAAEEAINREGVPVPYRNRIRAYFDTLSSGGQDGE